ncbi:4a-hydroxytetrahydrobiopterin dehydratase [Haloferula luteola]|uniref:Putative pterin-4-alpha-carbinolamine dehydratase n=1 Tax=Haloferula luteola TaxID=595692 RepID=A0A840V226_9BACT|nr:4a-hydroxytetrahydrobiopterin dehydratase [Haloferula luteola]MBB5352377.1 4a-hydroxytetrahydrobiopterin dehydratase [Haloferula luteola]
MNDLLSPEELADALKHLPDWEHEGKTLVRTVEFEDFNEAIDFVNDVAEIAEEEGHHPDILIRYSKVTLTLTTHDVGGLTSSDLDLAHKVDNQVD